MPQITFVRHGESATNALNVLAGKLDAPLTPFGRHQAHQAAQQLLKQNASFDLAITSTLSRAQDTLQTIKDAGVSIGEVRYESALDERDFGLWTGSNRGVLKRIYGFNHYEAVMHSGFQAPPQGESMEQVYHRVREYWQQYLQPLPDETRVLLVVHKYIIEVFALIGANRSPADYFDFKIPNSKAIQFEELPHYLKPSNKATQKLGDWLTTWIPELGLLAFVVGLFAGHLRLIPTSSAVAMFNLLLFTAASSIDLLDTKIAVRACNYKDWGLRTLAGLFLAPITDLSYAMLLTPSLPAVSAVAKSLGGAGMKAAAIAFCSSLLLPPVFAIQLLFHRQTQGIGYYLLLWVIASLIPFALSQFLRKKFPIAVGDFFGKWSWISGALRLLAVASVTANTLPFLHFDQTSITLFIAYFLAVLISILISTDAKRSEQADIYLAQSTINPYVLLGAVEALGYKGQATIIVYLFVLHIYLGAFWLTHSKRNELATAQPRMSRPALYH